MAAPECASGMAAKIHSEPSPPPPIPARPLAAPAAAAAAAAGVAPTYRGILKALKLPSPTGLLVDGEFVR